MFNSKFTWLIVLVLCLGVADDAEAKRRKKKARRYSGPPPTHPVVLWARTLSESTDREQRKVAAFKLSQYSQPIFQSSVIDSLVRCMKDNDVEIKVLCGKAMARAGTVSNAESIRRLMLEQFNADPALRQTIARAFIARKDASPDVHDTLLDYLKKSKDQEETLTYLGYFEQFGSGKSAFADTLVDIYKKTENLKIKRAVVKALAERGQGQDVLVDILVQCSDSKDTPLALNCLSGLQLQAKKDSRVWQAVEKTIQSTDPDVVLATLDVINALHESPNPRIVQRLVEILDDSEDADIREKAALALGVAGDASELVVNTLLKLIDDSDTDEATRIAAVLVLGKQAVGFPDKASEVLSKCTTPSKSQSLRTACELASRELEARKKLSAKATPAKEEAPAATAGGEPN